MRSTRRGDALSRRQSRDFVPKTAVRPEPRSALASSHSRITGPKEEIAMRAKLAISALVVAAMFGATATAWAQNQPAPAASSEGKVGADAAKSNMKPGVTTGSATRPQTNKGVAPNPTSQSDNDAGNSRGK
jgi:hypothetical protein